MIVDITDGIWQQFTHKLKGFSMLGMVEINSGDPGALALRKSDGKYFQVNGGYTRGVDIDQYEMRIEVARLKAKAKGEGGFKAMRVVNLDSSSLDSLRRYANGNVSEALRKMAEMLCAFGMVGMIPLETTRSLKRHVSVTLDDITVNRLKELGGGNMSYGARRCATFISQMGLDIPQ